jgi:hypothetical protein
MFGLGRSAAVQKRAELIARMVGYVRHGLQTKSYEQFVESFSNPDGQPDVSDRHRRELNFQMRVSPTCWYDATAFYWHGTPFVGIQGGGDDYGVFITAHGDRDSLISVDFHKPLLGRQSGRDARAMVRALQVMPGWTSTSSIERLLGR